MFRDYGDSDNNISDKEPSISINYESSKNFTKKEISKSTKTSRCINISFNNNIINNSNLHLYLKFYNEIRDIIFGQNVKDDNISFIHEEMIKRINKLKELESTHKIKFEII
jgi:phenylalanyl-tRNA synthetase alpha subunit